MTTVHLHFKWTVSRGRNTYGCKICTLLANGEKVSRCIGGSKYKKGVVFAGWIKSRFQPELIKLFSSEIATLQNNPHAETFSRQGVLVKSTSQPKNYYGVSIYLEKEGPRIELDGEAGFCNMERIANAIGITLHWNPESTKYKNHTYYTAFIN